MELRHLRYFVAVAEARTFTLAAARLGIQQPPLSQQIKMLETELGFSLFRRLPKGVELTVGGKVFLEEARRILANVERAGERAASAAQGKTGKLTLGFTTSVITHPLAPRMIGGFLKAYPDVQVEFREGSAASLIHAVANGSLDVGAVRTPVVRPEGVRFRTLLRESMLLVLPARHPIALAAGGGKTKDLPMLSLKALRNESFILARRTGAPGMFADLILACHRVGFEPKIAVEIEHMLSNIALVAGGLGVTAVPESMRGIHSSDVVYFKPKEAAMLSAPLTLVSREDTVNPASGRFLEFVESLADSPTTGATRRPRKG
ncbi:MAG: LysR family transcriptional regulator [Betaproteobacteria bacterium]|nr:LysR family transcriptional regulator [Betaproteobacteria bacterium]